MARQSAEIFEDGDFNLTRAERAMVDAVTANFSKVIVVMNVGGMVDSCWFHDDAKIQSVLMAWQGGIEGGLAAAELLMERAVRAESWWIPLRARCQIIRPQRISMSQSALWSTQRISM